METRKTIWEDYRSDVQYLRDLQAQDAGDDLKDMARHLAKAYEDFERVYEAFTKALGL